MPIRTAIKKHLWHNWWERLLVVALAAAALCATAAVAYAAAYTDRAYPGVFVGSHPAGSLTEQEVKERIAASSDTLDRNGLIFVFRDRTVIVPTVVATTDDPDLSYTLIDYDVDASAQAALAYGRTGSAASQWLDRFRGLAGRAMVVPRYTWREDAVRELLSKNLSSLEEPRRDASLRITNGVPEIIEEREGIVFDYGQAISEARYRLDSFTFSPIELKLKRDVPLLTKADADPLLGEVQKALFSLGASVRHEDSSWFWPASALNGLLAIRLNESGDPVLGFSEERFTVLLAPIAAEINKVPQEPKFAIEGEKVVEFKASRHGRQVNQEQTRKQWERELIFNRAQEVAPVVDIVPAARDIAELNDLGITELLGVGMSNFAGSPANRRHNIRVGAEAVNGTLIPPGEEFSLLKTLGTINGATGYLPELVIKGNQTIPEYGGGLCQIGTTTFRGTLAAGLPVTARRNHSYSVSYYLDEKGLPGTDATIYDPAPDYRFKNDTQNYVLIATRIEGSELFFEYWGTKDGREVVQSDTRVWDRVAPPPTKYVETLDLPVGKTKCTESPHAGLKAAFDYAITYADGTKNETTFTSHYRPWQEVCLIGVEALSVEGAEEGLELDGADAPAAAIQ
ncbi:MAG: VanW family protein [Patescibacteria group bacterium]|nr:VanW family protein [Patescibacteria group bacterium]